MASWFTLATTLAIAVDAAGRLPMPTTPRLITAADLSLPRSTFSFPTCALARVDVELDVVATFARAGRLEVALSAGRVGGDLRGERDVDRLELGLGVALQSAGVGD